MTRTLWLVGIALAVAPAAARADGGEDEVAAEAEPEEQEEALDVDVSPYAVIVGGLHYQHISDQDEASDRESRFTTVALSRIGLRASLGENLSIESEFEVNAGPHGTSVWEGQAALQVRNQLLRVDFHGLRVDVGRITDPASLDYFSTFVANMLLTDPLTRYPLLLSGFNRGNGVLVSYEVIDGLRLAFTVNAGNPTSTTATVQAGGTFPPFARFYEVPHSHVGRDARRFPLDSFHVVLMAPSVVYEGRHVRAFAEGQYFIVNTNTNSTEDVPIRGYNTRAGLQLLLVGGLFRPFLNGSRTRNDVVDPTDTARISNHDFEAITASGGADFVLEGGHGVGFQYSFVREVEEGGTVQLRHFMNVGGSWWFHPRAALDARYGLYVLCEDRTCFRDGEHSIWLTARAVLGPESATGAGRRP